MIDLRLRPNKLRPNNIPHTIRHKDSSSHKALLRLTRNIRHTDRNNEADDGAEEADDGVADHGRRGVVAPLALPDDGAAGDDGEAA